LNEVLNKPAASDEKPMHPILPNDTVAGRSLIAVIAIMSFLAALTVGAMQIVRTTAAEWRGDVTREVTIQIRPIENNDIEVETRRAVDIAKRAPGVTDVQAYTKQETEKLLEPWLGAGLDLSTLPMPRLIKVRMQNIDDTDMMKLRTMLSENIPNATLDDHRGWSERIASVANMITFTGFIVLTLVLIGTVLSISFATRGAVAANRGIVEVLHFVGAHNSYIAHIFQHHFLMVGLKGGMIGGIAAGLLFIILRFAITFLRAMESGGDTVIFFGTFGLNEYGYLGIISVVGFVAFITAMSSRMTVHRTLRAID
jgi:cell division transport system permease protein